MPVAPHRHGSPADAQGTWKELAARKSPALRTLRARAKPPPVVAALNAEAATRSAQYREPQQGRREGREQERVGQAHPEVPLVVAVRPQETRAPAGVETVVGIS